MNESLEERMTRVEGVLEQLDKRMSSLEVRLNHLEAWLRWMLGILITMRITIILSIILK